MKNKNIITLSVLSMSLTLGLVTFSSLTRESVDTVFSNPSDISRTYNSGNSPSEATNEYSNFTHAFEEFVSFNYVNARRASSNHIELGLNGYLQKNEKSKGLTKINIVYTGNIRIETSYDGNFDSGTYLSLTPQSGVDLELSGNYFRIVGLNSSNIITSFVIEYDCKNEVNPPSHNRSELSNFTTDDNGYFSTLREENNHTYFTFMATVSEQYENDQILPSELKLKQDGSGDITAKKINYLSSNKIEAYFDLDEYASNINNAFTFYPHVYVRDIKQEIFNSSGDLRMSTSRGNNKVLLGAYQVSEHYAVALDEMKWDEDNDAMPVIHFVNISSLPKYHASTYEVFDVSNSRFYLGGGEVITSDGGSTCNNKVKFANNGTRSALMYFYSDVDVDLDSYGFDMSWNNRWGNSGNLCYLSLNGTKTLINKTYNGTSWETGHTEYKVNGGHIHRGVNFINVEGIYNEGEAHAADEGYELSLYGVTLYNDVEQKTSFGSFTSDDYLTVNGTDIVNRNGKKVYLRGVNMGGYLVHENWMSYIVLSNDFQGSKDHLNLTNYLYTTYGEQDTLDYFETYRNYFLNEDDFILMKNMGITSIRLPFTYMNVDPDYHNIERDGSNKFNFRILDNVIDLAEEYGIYITLDLHGAYGSQNGEHHSGQEIANSEDVTFYNNETLQNKTIELWEEITRRYKNNPAIAGFDILNEPGIKNGTTTSLQWNVFDKIYDAIRAIDEDRIIIIESCWEGSGLPEPSTYGWENVMYSFQHYTANDWDAPNPITSDYHIFSFNRRLDNIKNMKFNIPVQIGEFTCYGFEDAWTNTLDVLHENNWHYNLWNYKIANVSEDAYSGWSIVTAVGSWTDIDKSDISYVKWISQRLATSNENTALNKLDSGNTLKSILEQYL